MAPPQTLVPASAKPVFDDMVAKANTDGVWLPAPDPALADQLHAVIDKFAAKGHKVAFVLYDGGIARVTNYRDLATSIQKETSGTVFVIGPKYGGTASSDFSRTQLETAQDDMTWAQPGVAANQYYDRMINQEQVPWTGITVGLLAAIVIGAVGAKFFGDRRASRSRTAAGAASGDTPDAGSSADSAAATADGAGSHTDS